MTDNQPPMAADEVARLSASLDEELMDILSDLGHVLELTGQPPEPPAETAPPPLEGPDEVVLPDEFELPEGDAPPPAPEPQAAPPAGPPRLADDFESAAADISPAADHDHLFDLELTSDGGMEIEIVEVEPGPPLEDDFDAPLPDFKPDDWDDQSDSEDRPEPVPDEADQLTVKVGDLSVREFSRLIEKAVARGVRQALRKESGEADDF